MKTVERSEESSRDGHAEMTIVSDLISEQEAGTVSRAEQDPRGMAVTFIARGEYLALFIARRKNANALGGPLKRKYICRIIEVVDGGFRGAEGKAG